MWVFLMLVCVASLLLRDLSALDRMAAHRRAGSDQNCHYEDRAVLARPLQALYQEIESWGDAGSNGPPRNEIRGLDTPLYLLGRAHIFKFPDLSASPLDLVSYWRWLVDEASADTSGGEP